MKNNVETVTIDGIRYFKEKDVIKLLKKKGITIKDTNLQGEGE